MENNNYFPIQSVNRKILQNSETHTVCHWKGTASYYNLEVSGKTNIDAVWFYPEPSILAKNIIDRVAFWKGVQIIKD